MATLSARNKKPTSLIRKILSLPIDNIAQLENIRLRYKDKDLSELMVSMKQSGLLQPIGVKDLGDDEYEVVFGNRRLLAADKLGWTEIDAQVVNAATDVDKKVMNIVENVQRSDVSLPEQGRSYLELVEDYGLTPSEVGARCGVTPKHVNNCIRSFRNTPAKFRNKIVSHAPGRSRAREGKVTGSAALMIDRISRNRKLNHESTLKLYEWASKDGSDVRKLDLVGAMLAQDFTLEEALELSADVRHVALTVTLNTKKAAALEEKYKTTIHNVLYATLMSNADLGVVGAGRGGTKEVMKAMGISVVKGPR